MDEHELKRLAVEFAGHLLGAVAIGAAGWLALRFLRAPFRGALERSRIDPAVASFLANSLRTALLVVVILGVLQQFGVTTASLLTLLGAAGLAIALSLQTSLANFASGLLLLSFRLVRVGDVIEVGELRGEVTELLPFHVVLVGADNLRIVVPNSLLTNGPVRNHSALPTRRVQWLLPLSASDDLEAIKSAVRARLAAEPRILPEPPPHLYLQDWTADKRTLAVAAWTARGDFLTVQQDLLEGLAEVVERTRRREP